MAPAAPPRYSIIIRNRNEGWNLEALFASLRVQNVKEFEVVFVDNDSTDGSRRIARAQTAALPLAMVEIRRRDFSYARASNAGARAARGEILVYLSADATPIGADWLERLTAPFADPRTAMAFGRQLPRPRCDPLLARDIASTYPEGPRVFDDPAYPGVFFSTANGAIRKADWTALPFDEAAVTGGEDQRYAEEWLGRGRTSVYAPEAAVVHSNDRYSLRMLFVDSMRYALWLRLRRHPVEFLRPSIRGWLRRLRGDFRRDLAFLRGRPGGLRFVPWALARTAAVETGMEIGLRRARDLAGRPSSSGAPP